MKTIALRAYIVLFFSLFIISIFQNCAPMRFETPEVKVMGSNLKKCPASAISCNTDRGSGYQTCTDSDEGPIFGGECIMESCLPPYVLAEGKCTTSCSPEGVTRACSIPINNGTGTETCANGLWGSCQIACNIGFFLNASKLCQANFIELTANNLEAIKPTGVSEILNLKIKYAPSLTYAPNSATTIKATGGTCAALTNGYPMNTVVNWRKDNLSTSTNYFAAYSEGSTESTNSYSISKNMIGCNWEACAEAKLGNQMLKDCLSVQPIIPACNGQDEYFLATASECRTCPLGQIPSLDRRSCVSCATNQIESPVGNCMTCPTGQQPNISGTACENIPAIVCSGTDPANSVLCMGDNSNLTSSLSKIVVSNCTNNRKCEYICNSGFENVSGSCVAVSCQGADPSNATLCSGDNIGLSSSLTKIAVANCTSTRKCEYQCNSGFEFNGVSCVAAACTGVTPSGSSLCSGDSTGLATSLSKLLVPACTTNRKCEFICGSGQTPNSTGTACEDVCTQSEVLTATRSYFATEYATDTQIAEACIDSSNPSLADNLPSTVDKTIRFVNTCGNRYCQNILGPIKGYFEGRVVEYMNSSATLECRRKDPPPTVKDVCRQKLELLPAPIVAEIAADANVDAACVDSAVGLGRSYPEIYKGETSSKMSVRWIFTCSARYCRSLNKGYKSGRMVERGGGSTYLNCYNEEVLNQALSGNTVVQTLSTTIDAVATNCIDEYNLTASASYPNQSAAKALRFVNTCGSRHCALSGFRTGYVTEIAPGATEALQPVSVICYK